MLGGLHDIHMARAQHNHLESVQQIFIELNKDKNKNSDLKKLTIY